MAVGAVAVLGLAKGPLASDSLHFDTFSAKVGAIEYRFDDIDVAGGAFSSADMATLFGDTDVATRLKTLATLNADRIHFGQYRQTETIAGEVRSTILSNVTLNDLHAGVIGAAHVDSGVFGLVDKRGEASSGSFGAMDVVGTDWGAMLALSSPAPEGDAAPFKALYRSTVLNDLKVETAMGTRFVMARLAVKDVEVRNSKDGLFTAIAHVMKQPGPADTPETPAEANKRVLTLIDVVSAFRVGSVEGAGIRIIDKASDEPPLVIERFGYDGGGADGHANFTLDGLIADATEIRLRIGHLEQRDVSLAPAIAALRTAMAKPDASLATLDPKLLIPSIGRITAKNIDYRPKNLPDLDVSIGAVSFGFNNPNGGLPDSIDASVKDFKAPIPTDPNDAASETLRGLGYRELAVSESGKISFDRQGRTVTLQTALSAREFGAVEATATLGNITPDTLFSSSDAAMLALLAASLKDVSITLSNDGVVERFLDQEAEKTGRTPAQIRETYAAAAAASLQVYLGMSSEAQIVTDAVVGFLEAPTRLTLTAHAKQPAGVSLADSQAIDGPAGFLKLFEITQSRE